MDHPAEGLIGDVYDELRRLAAGYVRRERANSVQATELVHEAYLRLLKAKQTAVEGSDAFPGHRRDLDAPVAGRAGTRARRVQARRRSPAGHTRRAAARHGTGRRATPSILSRSIVRSRAWPASIRSKPASSSFGFSAACRLRKRARLVNLPGHRETALTMAKAWLLRELDAGGPASRG